MSPGAITALSYRPEERGHVERMPNLEDRRGALLRETEVGLRDSLGHLWPYVEEMRGLEEGFAEGEQAVIPRYLQAVTEATHRHAEKPSEGRLLPPANLDNRGPSILGLAQSVQDRPAGLR